MMLQRSRGAERANTAVACARTRKSGASDVGKRFMTFVLLDDAGADRRGGGANCKLELEVFSGK